MQMNPGIILAGQTPDLLGAVDRGNSAAARQNAFQRQNALAQVYQEQGPGILAGEQNALNALAMQDPMQALGVQQTQQQMQISQEQLQMARQNAQRQAQAWAQGQDAATVQAEAAKLAQGLKGAAFFHSQGDQQGYQQFLAQSGLDPAEYPFEMFPAFAASVEGVLGVLQGFQPKAVEPTTGFNTLHQKAVAGGVQPGTPEYQRFMLEGSSPQTVVNVGGDQGPRTGTIPQGYMLVDDPESPGGVRMAPIQGGPADTTDNEAQRQRNTQMAGATVIQDLQRALDLLPELGTLTGAGGVTGGLARSASAQVPGTLVNRITQFTESALSNVGLDTLQRMREASPTGGALGQVPIQQQKRLEQVLGSLDITQPPGVLEDNIKRVMNIYTDIIFGTADERARAVREGRMSPDQSSEVDSYYYPLSFDERGRSTQGAQQRPSAQQPAQRGPVTPAQIRAMDLSQINDVDVMSLDAAGLDAFDARLRELGQ